MKRGTVIVRAGVLLLLGWALAAAGWLLGGAIGLEVLLPGGLPAGNALAASIFCALAAAAWLGSRPRCWPRRAAAVALVAAVAWLPVSILLAGNAALNFSNGRGPAWLWFNAGVALVVLVALAWALAAGACHLLRRDRQRV